MVKIAGVLFYSSLLAVVSLSAGSCKKAGTSDAPVPPPPPVPVVVTSATKTYLALGDSYTIGQNVQATERFPYFITTGLRTQGISISDPQYIATTGWTTANLQGAIAQSAPGTFDVVTLLIGVNDQYQGVDTGMYRVRFTQLVQKAIDLAAGQRTHVFVLSIPDYSATPFVGAGDKPRVSMQIDWFNAINKQVTLQNAISYTDITPLTRQAATDPTLLANDGLHYSGKEHQKWADLLVPAIKKILQ